MADSSVAVTPGTGAAVDTRTNALGEHRQVMVIGGDGDPIATVTANGELVTANRSNVGRVRTVGYVEAYATATTEALAPIAVQRSGEAIIAASGTALSVTAGKTFRLQAISGSITLTGTTVATTRLRLRYNPAGAVALTSPIAFTQRIGGTTAIAAHVYNFTVFLPEGFDFLAGTGLGVSVLSTAAMHSLDLNLLGFEF